MASSLGVQAHPWRTVLTFPPVLRGGRRPDCCSKAYWATGVWETETDILHGLSTGNNRTLRVLEGRPQDNTGNPSCPPAWIGMNSPALSPTLMWPYPKRKGLVAGSLYLEVEGQSWLVDNVDRGLRQNLANWAARQKNRSFPFFFSYRFFPRSHGTAISSAKYCFIFAELQPCHY